MSKLGIEGRIEIIRAGLAADMTYSEIARQIGISRSAVAGVVHRHLRTKEEVQVEVAPAPVEPAEIISDIGLPNSCDMRISHPLGDHAFECCGLIGREGETEVYKGRFVDEKRKATPSLRDATLVADGRDRNGNRVVVVRDVDLQIKSYKDPWYYIRVSPRDDVDISLIRGALAAQEGTDPHVRLLDDLPIDGSIVSLDVPMGTGLTSFGEFVLHRYPNRIAVARRDRSSQAEIRRFVSDVRTSATGLTSVILTANGRPLLFRDVSVESYWQSGDTGMDIRLEPHRDLQTLLDIHHEAKAGIIADEDLRDAYHAARRSEHFIRSSRVGVGIDAIIDLAQRRGLTKPRTIDDIDADFDRICSPIIEKQRKRREKADRR